MFRVLIIIAAGLVLSVTVSKGEWLQSAIVIVTACVLLLMGAGERMETRARWNRTRYWAEGGPDRRRVRYRRK